MKVGQIGRRYIDLPIFILTNDAVIEYNTHGFIARNETSTVHLLDHCICMFYNVLFWTIFKHK